MAHVILASLISIFYWLRISSIFILVVVIISQSMKSTTRPAFNNVNNNFFLDWTRSIESEVSFAFVFVNVESFLSTEVFI